MRASRLILAAFLALGAAAAAAETEPPGRGGRSVQQRHDELARAQEMLGDPDPLARLAMMESLVASGDATATYVALRAALSSDDPAMRNLAMRTWIAGLKRLNLSVVLPGDLQKQADAALLDPKVGTDFYRRTPWLEAWSRRAFQVSLGFTEVDVAKNTGKVISLPPYGQQPDEFTISGTQLFITVPLDFHPGPATCHLTLAPTAALVLEGVVACDFNFPSPQFRVTAPML